METKTNLEQAKAYFEKAEQCLDKVREVHDHTLASQRKIAFAMSSLIGKPVQLPEGSFAEDVVQAVEETEEQIRQRQEIEVMNTLMSLALMNRDVLEIAVQYTAHVQWFEVEVHELVEPEVRFSERHSPLLLERIRLNDEFADTHGSALDNLLMVEDKLIDLIAEARDKQEQEGEVAA
ncbi:hypothetical protein L3Q72_19810 [Vibrio sp. JC009]|uniref:hypothetical protein n=1 Tax=Vibrio sp. JC009 TaxID=2912314 RepID=UPI0023AF0144|nr:hypothetical protein [Vibrio sp. JC009]WED23488.1 hypothetical protein L3Q72_19810 [Vibrio sp. JC009]